MVIEALKRVFLRQRTEGHEGIETPPDVTARFELGYQDLLIGWLRLRDGQWIFEYAPEFQKQSDVKPLVDFPDLHKTYVSADLWPFFLSRIPSLAQPQVRQTIQDEGLDEHSDVDLLKRFGERTITNPFTLTYTPDAA
jgi:hypothetical protein